VRLARENDIRRTGESTSDQEKAKDLYTDEKTSVFVLLIADPMVACQDCWLLVARPLDGWLGHTRWDVTARRVESAFHPNPLSPL